MNSRLHGIGRIGGRTFGVLLTMAALAAAGSSVAATPAPAAKPAPVAKSAPTATVSDSSMTLRAGQAGTEFRSMTVEGEDRVHIDFVRPELVLDLELRPAGVQESVTVTADIPVLDLSSARIGVNVSQREVDGLPVNGRQMSQLMLQAPGSQSSWTERTQMNGYTVRKANEHLNETLSPARSVRRRRNAITPAAVETSVTSATRT